MTVVYRPILIKADRITIGLPKYPVRLISAERFGLLRLWHSPCEKPDEPGDYEVFAALRDWGDEGWKEVIHLAHWNGLRWGHARLRGFECAERRFNPRQDYPWREIGGQP